MSTTDEATTTEAPPGYGDVWAYSRTNITLTAATVDAWTVKRVDHVGLTEDCPVVAVDHSDALSMQSYASDPHQIADAFRRLADRIDALYPEAES